MSEATTDELLLNAITHDDVEAVSALIKNGVSADSPDDRGTIPLHYAVSRSNVDIIRLLITHGSNINTADKWGMTPLHIAASSGNGRVVSEILKAGANPNVSSLPCGLLRILGTKQLST